MNLNQLAPEKLLLLSYFTEDELKGLTWKEIRFLAALEDEELPEAVPDVSTIQAQRAYGGRMLEQITAEFIWNPAVEELVPLTENNQVSAAAAAERRAARAKTITADTPGAPVPASAAQSEQAHPHLADQEASALDHC